MSETTKKTVENEEVAVAAVEPEIVEAEPEKPYTFRKLSSPDIFLMTKIIGKIGINEFVDCFDKDGVLGFIKGLTTEEKESESGAMLAAASVILEIANVVFGNLHKCEKEIYQLLEQTSNLTVEEITAEGNGVMFFEMLIDFIKKDEFPDFIKVVSKLFK